MDPFQRALAYLIRQEERRITREEKKARDAAAIRRIQEAAQRDMAARVAAVEATRLKRSEASKKAWATRKASAAAASAAANAAKTALKQEVKRATVLSKSWDIRALREELHNEQIDEEMIDTMIYEGQIDGKIREAAQRLHDQAPQGILGRHQAVISINGEVNNFSFRPGAHVDGIYYKMWRVFHTEDTMHASLKTDGAGRMNVQVVGADHIAPERIAQSYRAGEVHCVIQPLINKWIDMVEHCESDSSRKRMRSILINLYHLRSKYEAGVPEEHMEEVGKTIYREIVIHDILGNVITSYNKKSSKQVHFTNTRLNHVEPGRLTLDKDFEMITAERMQEILAEHKQDNIFCLVDGTPCKRLRSIRGAWCVENPNAAIFREFNKSTGIANYSLSAVKYAEVNAFVKEACLINSTPVALCSTPNEMDGVTHLDVTKAYTQHKHAPYYRGFLGHIQQYRNLDGMDSEFIRSHVGIYRFLVTVQPNALLSKLGIHCGMMYTLPSPEIEYFLGLGVKIQLLGGCWGSTFEFDYTEEMLQKRRYCVWAGKLASDREYDSYDIMENAPESVRVKKIMTRELVSEAEAEEVETVQVGVKTVTEQGRLIKEAEWETITYEEPIYETKVIKEATDAVWKEIVHEVACTPQENWINQTPTTRKHIEYVLEKAAEPAQVEKVQVGVKTVTIKDPWNGRIIKDAEWETITHEIPIYETKVIKAAKEAVWKETVREVKYHRSPEWIAHLKHELGVGNVVHYGDLGYTRVQIPKKNYRTKHHVLAFITSYTRLNMLRMMESVKGELVKVVLDGLYFRGTLEEAGVPVVQKPFVKHNGFHDRWYNPCTNSNRSGVNTWLWATYHPTFDGNVVLRGAGGCGKSHSVFTDYGLIQPLYVVPSHVLGKKMRSAHGCQYTTIHNLIGQKTDNVACSAYNINHKDPEIIFIDEVTMIEGSWIDKAIKMYPHSMFIVAGDVDVSGQWYQCRSGNGSQFNTIWSGGNWRSVEYTTDYRARDDKLREMKYVIREMMRAVFTKGGLYDAVRLNAMVKRAYPVMRMADAAAQFKHGDTWIAGTHKTNAALLALGVVSGGMTHDKEIVYTYEDGVEKRGSFTTHSFQGLTISEGRVFISINDAFEYAMLYTAVSRCVHFEQVVLVA